MGHAYYTCSEDLSTVTLSDNVNLIPTQYKEQEDTEILRPMEEEIEEAFPEIIQIKNQQKQERRKRN